MPSKFHLRTIAAVDWRLSVLTEKELCNCQVSTRPSTFTTLFLHTLPPPRQHVWGQYFPVWDPARRLRSRVESDLSIQEINIYSLLGSKKSHHLSVSSLWETSRKEKGKSLLLENCFILCWVSFFVIKYILWKEKAILSSESLWWHCTGTQTSTKGLDFVKHCERLSSEGCNCHHCSGITISSGVVQGKQQKRNKCSEAIRHNDTNFYSTLGNNRFRPGTKCTENVL